MVSSFILDTTGNSAMVIFGVTIEPYLKRGFTFAILHSSGNKDRFIDKFTRLHRGNAKTSATSFKNFEDMPSKSGIFDETRQAKVVSNVALHSSKL